MADGTKYDNKQDLLDAVERVFRNTDYQTTSDNIQKNDKDIIESLWDRASAVGSFTEVTYSELVNLINTSGLAAGAWYQITDYQTIHYIGKSIDDGPAQYNDTTTTYDNGSGNVTTFTPETENLLVMAVSTNMLSKMALSKEHPQDIIYYDYSDDETENTLRSRKGFIQYRCDTNYNLSAWYDWRNCLSRRYFNDGTFNGATTWDVYARNFGDNADYSEAQITTIPYMTDTKSPYIGGLQINADQGYHDFRTFATLDSQNVLSGQTEGGFYRDIHIGQNHSGEYSSGSGVGVVISAPVANGRIPDIVFLTSSAYDINIGSNCVGLTFACRTARYITVGDGNESHNFGGKDAIQYSGSLITQGGFEHVTVGNSNRAISFGDYYRNLEIGNSNINIGLSRFSAHTKIGSENSDIFVSYGINVEIGNGNEVVHLFGHQNARIGDANKNIRIRGGSASVNPSPVNSPSLPYPLSGGGVVSYVYQSSPRSLIYDMCENVEVITTGVFEIGSNSSYITIITSDDTIIRQNCHNITVTASPSTRIGSDCRRIEMSGDWIGRNHVGSASQDIGINGAYNRIGEACSNVYIMSESFDNLIGDRVSNTVLTFSQNNRIHNNCYNLTLRVARRNTIMQEAYDIFFEDCLDNTVGAGSYNISFNNFPLNYIWRFSETQEHENFLFTQELAQNFYAIERFWNVPHLDVITPQVSSLQVNEAATYPNLGPTSNGNVVEQGCSNISFVGATANRVESFSSGIAFGSDVYSGTANYGLAWDGNGNVEAYNSATVQAATDYVGQGCNDNQILGACTNVKVLGTNMLFNTFASINNVTTDPNFTFERVKMLMQPPVVTLGVNLANITIDKKSPDGEVWYDTIDNAGVVTPVKLV